MRIQLTGALICFMLSLSLSVAVWGSFKESKSTVIPNGIAIWSVLAYRRPIEPPELSTRWVMSYFVRSFAVKKFFNLSMLHLNIIF